MFSAHADQVYAFAAHRLDPDSAGDVVSEVYLAAWRRIGEIRDPALPWLLGTARKVISNELRGRTRRSALTERLRATADESAAVDGVPEVMDALRELSEPDQEVLTLAEWYGLSGREAAQVLGCSTGTYAVRLHRARRRLRQRLEEFGVPHQATGAQHGPAATATLREDGQ
ncbi:RNA polymerase sigma factor [Streptomyces polyrhachis]|uniref:RNA polymerase sigma factor n=1 Tax=Streptomyces polyrhachis TaxID=1282885 RepID=A0ABW2G7T7_9ACTN